MHVKAAHKWRSAEGFKELSDDKQQKVVDRLDEILSAD